MTNAVTLKFQPHALKAAVNIAARAMDKRSPAPVLERILVRSQGGRISLTGTNLDRRVTTLVEGITDGDVAFVVTPRALRAFAGIAAGEITMTISGDDPYQSVLFEDGENVMRLKTEIVAAEYPDAPIIDIKAGIGFEIAPADLRRLLSLSRHCISTEETRFYLNGVYLTCIYEDAEDKTKLRAVSTDGHRLACIDSDVEVPDFKGIILHRDAVDVLLAVLPVKSNNMITVYFDGTFMKLITGSLNMHFRLIDGTFPDYRRVMPARPSDMSANLTLAAVTKLNSMSRALNFSRGESMKIRDGKLIVATDAETASVPVDAAAFNMSGYGFNSRYVVEQARLTPQFTISAASEALADPVNITSDAHPDARWVLMPMRG